MAGLIRRRNLGTQPAPASPSMRGRHNRGGGPRHMGGGGGGGGGGRNRIPNTGLYRGKAGEAAANQNPEAFFRAAVSRLGGLDYSGTPISQFSQDYVASLLDQYNSAVAGKQRTSPVDFLKQQYGAGFLGRKGRNFNPGQLAGPGGALEEAYNDWYSNTMTNDFLTGRLAEGGGYVPSGGNVGFQRFVQEGYAPGLLAEVAGARAANPRMSVADLIAGRDLVNEARTRFLARPDTMRQPSPINLGSRWSYWE